MQQFQLLLEFAIGSRRVSSRDVRRPPPSSSAPAATTNPAAVAQITTNWEKFFASSTPVSEKVTLLQNGNLFSGGHQRPDQPACERARRQGHRRDGELPHLGHRDLQPHRRRIVLLSGQTGTAVYENGVWKVGDASLCGLLKLVPGGSEPAACSSAG